MAAVRDTPGRASSRTSRLRSPARSPLPRCRRPSAGNPKPRLPVANGICCLASYLTMSGIFLASTGGNLMNRDKPLCPETEIATRSPLTELRERNVVERFFNQLGRIGVRLAEHLWVFDVIEAFGDNRIGRVAGAAAQRFERIVPGRFPKRPPSLPCENSLVPGSVGSVDGNCDTQLRRCPNGASRRTSRSITDRRELAIPKPSLRVFAPPRG